MSSGVDERPSAVSLWALANSLVVHGARHERDARRHAAHAHRRRQRLGQQHGGVGQRGLGERVREVVGVRVVQLLVEQVHHAGRHARVRRLRGGLRGERLREGDRRGGVAAHQRLQQRGVEGGGAVVLEARGAVDHRVDAAEGLRDGRQQRGGGGGVGEIGSEDLHARTGGAQLFRRGGGLGERLRTGAAMVQRDVEAGVRQLERDHPADAARGARHQRHGARGGRLFGVKVVGVAHDPYNLIRCSAIQRPISTGTNSELSTPLVERIASRVAAAGGWMPFDDFMAEALYAPGLGYYSGGRRIFGLGPEGGSDFVTAPELSPFFGRALAVQVREALAASGTGRVYEFGAGSGALAEQLLEALDADDADDDGMLRQPVDLTIVELSGALRERQQARLARFAPRVQWLDAWPETHRGRGRRQRGARRDARQAAAPLRRPLARARRRGSAPPRSSRSRPRGGRPRRARRSRLPRSLGQDRWRRAAPLRLRGSGRAVLARRRDPGRRRADGRLLRRTAASPRSTPSPRASSRAWPTGCSAAWRSWWTTAFPSTSTTTRSAWAAR